MSRDIQVELMPQSGNRARGCDTMRQAHRAGLEVAEMGSFMGGSAPAMARQADDVEGPGHR